MNCWSFALCTEHQAKQIVKQTHRDVVAPAAFDFFPPKENAPSFPISEPQLLSGQFSSKEIGVTNMNSYKNAFIHDTQNNRRTGHCSLVATGVSTLVTRGWAASEFLTRASKVNMTPNGEH